MRANPRIDTDAQTAAFVRCLGAGHAQRYAALDAMWHWCRDRRYRPEAAGQARCPLGQGVRVRRHRRVRREKCSCSNASAHRFVVGDSSAMRSGRKPSALHVGPRLLGTCSLT